MVRFCLNQHEAASSTSNLSSELIPSVFQDVCYHLQSIQDKTHFTVVAMFIGFLVLFIVSGGGAKAQLFATAPRL